MSISMKNVNQGSLYFPPVSSSLYIFIFLIVCVCVLFLEGGEVEGALIRTYDECVHFFCVYDFKLVFKYCKKE